MHNPKKKLQPFLLLPEQSVYLSTQILMYLIHIWKAGIFALIIQFTVNSVINLISHVNIAALKTFTFKEHVTSRKKHVDLFFLWIHLLLFYWGDYVTLQTNGSKSSYLAYNTSAVVVEGHRHMMFHLVACHSAFIALSFLPHKLSSSTYEIALGIDDNAKSEFRTSGGGVAASEYVGQVLNCASGNDFWLSWTMTGVSFGFGMRFGENTMLQWQDAETSHDVNTISFASQSKAVWQIATVVG